VAGCCECGDEPSGSFATELVFVSLKIVVKLLGIECHENSASVYRVCTC
jgi:hypothetical protein